jgi:hypothetical protein
MRLLLLLSTTIVLAGCGTMQYEDTNTAVDARPECVDASTRPGEPVAPWCERKQSAGWTTDSKSEPLDLSGKDDD